MKKFIDDKLVTNNLILIFKNIFSNSFKNKFFILKNINNLYILDIAI